MALNHTLIEFLHILATILNAKEMQLNLVIVKVQKGILSLIVACLKCDR